MAVSQLDIFPTLLTLTGISPDRLLLDGMDLTGLLRSGKDAKVSERVLYWHFPAYLEGGNVETTDRRFRTRPVSVVRQGEWKLIENYETGKYELYNVVNDISEREELSGTYPQKVEELSRVLDQWKEEVHAPVPTELNPDYKNP